MPINHPKGILSNKKDFFYYSAHWDAWSRLILRGGEQQGFKKEIAISLTPAGGFNKEGGAFFIKSEYIRIYDHPIKHEGDIYTHVLPKAVYENIKDNIGLKATFQIVDYDYLPELNLAKLLEVTRLQQFSNLKLSVPFKGRLRERLEAFPDLYINPRG